MAKDRLNVAFGRASGDYGRHRAGFPEALFNRLRQFGLGLRGQRVLDLGTGTGHLARGFAARGCVVIGLDPDPDMLAVARSQDRADGTPITYIEGHAEATGLDDASFDVVAAGQCWHWFDRPKAARECHRLLAPGGRLLIAHYDWIPLPGNVVDATEALIREHNPKWKYSGGTGLYPWWLADAANAGFRDLEVIAFDAAQSYSHEAWRGRVRASAGVGASLSPEAVTRFDIAHEQILRKRFPEDPLSVPHRVFALIARRN